MKHELYNKNEINKKINIITNKISNKNNNNVYYLKHELYNKNEINKLTNKLINYIINYNHNNLYYNKKEIDDKLELKSEIVTGGASTIITDDLTIDRALISDINGKVIVSPITKDELNYLDGLTKNLNTTLQDISYTGSMLGGGSGTTFSDILELDKVGGTPELRFKYHATATPASINATNSLFQLNTSNTATAFRISNVTGTVLNNPANTNDIDITGKITASELTHKSIIGTGESGYSVSNRLEIKRIGTPTLHLDYDGASTPATISASTSSFQIIAPHTSQRFTYSNSTGIVLDVPANTSDFDVVGELTAGTKTFEIDHPNPDKIADNGYKWKLRHWCIENDCIGGSMLYNKKIDCDSAGTFEIEMPNWFKNLVKNVSVYCSPNKHFGNAYGDHIENTNIISITTQKEGVYNILIYAERNDEASKNITKPYVEYQKKIEIIEH